MKEKQERREGGKYKELEEILEILSQVTVVLAGGGREREGDVVSGYL